MNKAMDLETTIVRYINDELLTEPMSEPVRADEELLTSGLLDSIAVMQLVMFIEEQGNLTVPPEDVTVENFQTIRDLMVYLAGRADH